MQEQTKRPGGGGPTGPSSGFKGTGKADPEVADLLNEVEAQQRAAEAAQAEEARREAEVKQAIDRLFDFGGRCGCG